MWAQFPNHSVLWPFCLSLSPPFLFSSPLFVCYFREDMANHYNRKLFSLIEIFHLTVVSKSFSSVLFKKYFLFSHSLKFYLQPGIFHLSVFRFHSPFFSFYHTRKFFIYLIAIKKCDNFPSIKKRMHLKSSFIFMERKYWKCKFIILKKIKYFNGFWWLF